jgi:hypothetical protein
MNNYIYNIQLNSICSCYLKVGDEVFTNIFNALNYIKIKHFTDYDSKNTKHVLKSITLSGNYSNSPLHAKNMINKLWYTNNNNILKNEWKKNRYSILFELVKQRLFLDYKFRKDVKKIIDNNIKVNIIASDHFCKYKLFKIYKKVYYINKYVYL